MAMQLPPSYNLYPILYPFLTHHVFPHLQHQWPAERHQLVRWWRHHHGHPDSSTEEPGQASDVGGRDLNAPTLRSHGWGKTGIFLGGSVVLLVVVFYQYRVPVFFNDLTHRFSNEWIVLVHCITRECSNTTHCVAENGLVVKNLIRDPDVLNDKLVNDYGLENSTVQTLYNAKLNISKVSFFS